LETELEFGLVLEFGVGLELGLVLGLGLDTGSEVGGILALVSGDDAPATGVIGIASGAGLGDCGSAIGAPGGAGDWGSGWLATTGVSGVDEGEDDGLK
jgi:hypothetical protein